MSAWQFAFVCSRVLAAWLAVMLVRHVIQLSTSIALILQGPSLDVEQYTSGLGLSAMYLVALLFLNYYLWARPDVFADRATTHAETSPDDSPWERPAAYLLGFWLVLTSLPSLAGLLADFLRWRSIRDSLPLGADQFDQFVNVDSIGAVLAELLLGLLVMAYAAQIARWSRETLSARIAALRTAGVAQSPDDPAD